MADDLGSTEHRHSAFLSHPSADNRQILPRWVQSKCSNDYKVIAHQAKHLSVSEERGGEITARILFYESKFMAPVSICEILIKDVHGTRHFRIKKTYNMLCAVYWWLALFSLVAQTVNGCPTIQMSVKVNPCNLVYHLLETVHRPYELVNMNLLGPVTGIRS